MESKLKPKEWIKRAAARIAAKVKPVKIILFGSHAYGKPGKDSDLDLLVILPRRPSDRFKGYQRVNRAVGEHQWPLDILVRGLDEIESRIKIGDSFILEIMRRGKVLYASPGRGR